MLALSRTARRARRLASVEQVGLATLNCQKISVRAPPPTSRDGNAQSQFALARVRQADHGGERGGAPLIASRQRVAAHGPRARSARTARHSLRDTENPTEGEGYRRASAGRSRLVYEFTKPNVADRARQEPRGTPPPAPAAAEMATALVAAPLADQPTVAKKPSIKKYRAPTPPKKVVDAEDDCDSEKDKENDVVVRPEVHREDTKPQTADVPAEAAATAGPGAGAAGRGSVLSRAAMFEAGSPRARDPAEMSLRERKALFEKNKGAAIVPKAPFGLAPPAKALCPDLKAKSVKPLRPVVAAQAETAPEPPRADRSPEGDDVSQTSLGGGIKGKLAALFSKERTISESTIAGKYKLEREKEMEMLQTRFHHVKKLDQKQAEHESDNENEHEQSEKAPLMGSAVSLNQPPKKPEIIGQLPKVKFQEKCKSSNSLHDDAAIAVNDEKLVIGSQPVKRRSSQDSPVVLSVLEDAKRLKVNNDLEAPQSNGVAQSNGLRPHLPDTGAGTADRYDDGADCGGRSAAVYDDLWSDMLRDNGGIVASLLRRHLTKSVKAAGHRMTGEKSCCTLQRERFTSGLWKLPPYKSLRRRRG
ncbi:Anillin [Eumeta japonica]|uniref:Anillin n=1 Tax=Eumeta variegata TaxID=151549 RepID=A0A4C1WT01_EUMVA|nr:Anillin [Eumeta japonica]